MDLEFRCNECGDILDASIVIDHHGNPTVNVEACTRCIEQARDAGYEHCVDENRDTWRQEGYDDAKSEAEDE